MVHELCMNYCLLSVLRLNVRMSFSSMHLAIERRLSRLSILFAETILEPGGLHTQRLSSLML